MLPQGCCKGLRDCQITHKKYGPVTAVAWWDDNQKEPLLFCTFQIMRAFIYIDGFNFYYRAVRNAPYKWLDFKLLRAFFIE